MAIIVKPTIAVGNIQIQADPNAAESVQNILDNWGASMPVVKINDYPLAAGELLSFRLDVKFGTIPSFGMEVYDSNYTVRKALNDTIIDTGVVFIGYRNWYIKFNALFTVSVSDAGDTNINIDGIVWAPALHDNFQAGYTNRTVQDILADICGRTGTGLFTVNGPKLSQSLDNCLNASWKGLNFLNFVVNKYTNCLWAMDPMYTFHVVDWEQLQSQPLDQYTLGEKGAIVPATDMVLTTHLWPDDTDSGKLMVKWFTINTNFGKANIDTPLSMATYFEGGQNGTDEVDEDTTDQFGTSAAKANSFYGFKAQHHPFHNEMAAKLIAGKSITCEMENIIYEITPFSQVNFEAWLPQRNDTPTVMDTENSGRKTVIGYAFHFNRKTDTTLYPIVRQTIDLV
jgi:hypothetical protein